MHNTEFLSLCKQSDPQLRIVRSGQRDVSELAIGSFQVVDKTAFFALQGSVRDGREFISEAVQSGASYIVTDVRELRKEILDQIPRDVGIIQFANPRRTLAILAGKFYNHQPKHQVLVTGTNGKTSVVDYAVQLWRYAGYKATSIGTLGVKGDTPVDVDVPALTSLDSISLHKLLEKLKNQNIDRVGIEASSHGLVQHRLDGARPTVAVFTGLGRDHLDYHQSQEAYLEAKMILFEHLLPKDGLVLCAENTLGADRVKQICKRRGLRCLSYGIEVGDISAKNLIYTSTGVHFDLVYEDRSFPVNLPLLGEFQCMNVLAAFSAGLTSGVSLDVAVKGMGALSPVPGRLELVGERLGGRAYVDYAHTPDALERVLKDVRRHVCGKVFVVFGCGGNRDQGKRSLMGRIAVTYADCVVVTDDNPRFEEPSKIRSDIISDQQGIEEISPRDHALRFALDQVSADDVVIIAGKGHEEGQSIKGKVYPFNDKKIVQQHWQKIS